jgi:NADPH-dependent F420 reductase
MRIAIIGAGNVGGGLAAAAVPAGHEVIITAARPDHAAKVAEQTGATVAATPAEAARSADVVVLAVPAGAASEVLGQLGDAVVGPVVVDVTNPLNDTYSDLTTSGVSNAEQLAVTAPQAKLVKAFNTILASRLANPSEDGQQLDGFYAGDDEGAKTAVSQLLSSLGFRPIDAGGLRMARSLEELGFLNISLNARNGWSWQSGWKLVGPTA